MSEKIIGYTLLVSGIAIILFTAFNIIFVFTRQAQPVQLFNFPAISLDMNKSLGVALPNSKPTELVSTEMLNQTSNIFAHLLLMGFLAGVGQKLASLGVSLIRPIIVKPKEA